MFKKETNSLGDNALVFSDNSHSPAKTAPIKLWFDLLSILLKCQSATQLICKFSSISTLSAFSKNVILNAGFSVSFIFLHTHSQVYFSTHTLQSNIRNISGCTVETFKLHLDRFLATVPDEPQD